MEDYFLQSLDLRRVGQWLHDGLLIVLEGRIRDFLPFRAGIHRDAPAIVVREGLPGDLLRGSGAERVCALQLGGSGSAGLGMSRVLRVENIFLTVCSS